jgi:hypothetical protein
VKCEVGGAWMGGDRMHTGGRRGEPGGRGSGQAGEGLRLEGVVSRLVGWANATLNEQILQKLS